MDLQKIEDLTLEDYEFMQKLLIYRQKIYDFLLLMKVKYIGQKISNKYILKNDQTLLKELEKKPVQPYCLKEEVFSV